MARGVIQIGIDEINRLQQQVAEIEKAPKTVLKRLTSDAKKRVPGWVSQEVTKVYNIKKAEVMPSKNGGKSAGGVKVTGNTIESLALVYTGRLLTPTHFGMTPKSPPKGSYTLKHQVLKGQKKVLGKVKKLSKRQRQKLAANFRGEGTRSSQRSPVMLMPASKGGSTYIPFQRVSANRNDVEAVKTISVPQMVSSDRTAPAITQAINDGLDKRLAYHMDKLMPGK